MRVKHVSLSNDEAAKSGGAAGPVTARAGWGSQLARQLSRSLVGTVICEPSVPRRRARGAFHTIAP